MANDPQYTASQDTNPASGNELKTYSTITRTWPQASDNTHLNSTSCSNLYNQNSTSSSINTSTTNQYSHPSHHHNNTNNGPTPMDRWLAETQQQAPYSTIHGVENTHAGQGHAVEGGKRMERGNGGDVRGAEDNRSMERNEQSERWA